MYVKIIWPQRVTTVVQCKRAQWEELPPSESVAPQSRPTTMRLDLEDDKGCQTYFLERSGEEPLLDGSAEGAKAAVQAVYTHVYLMTENGRTFETLYW